MYNLDFQFHVTTWVVVYDHFLLLLLAFLLNQIFIYIVPFHLWGDSLTTVTSKNFML